MPENIIDKRQQEIKLFLITYDELLKNLEDLINKKYEFKSDESKEENKHKFLELIKKDYNKKYINENISEIKKLDDEINKFYDEIKAYTSNSFDKNFKEKNDKENSENKDVNSKKKRCLII